MTPETALAEALAGAKASFSELLVAVSGGGDSMALLHLARDWGEAQGVPVAAVTVDHGLRPEAAGEARYVASICAGLGIAHTILRWREALQGNLQSAAREARYDLIARHAGAGALILLGHTRDDVAETFLLRLARGSGVDGLAQMRAEWGDRGRRWMRPLLTCARADLRDWLAARGVHWVDDPSNDDTRFDRVKVRQAMSDLEELGLGAERLAATADAMLTARRALAHWAHEAALKLCRVEAGDVVIEAAGLAALPQETRTRLVSHAIRWVSGAAYRPRLTALNELLRDLKRQPRDTLGGVVVSATPAQLRFAREFNAVASLTCAPSTLWDGRWRLEAPGDLGHKTLEIRALGDAISQCPDWRSTGLPRDSLRASPAVWRGDELIAAPLAGLNHGWQAVRTPDAANFFTALLSH